MQFIGSDEQQTYRRLVRKVLLVTSAYALVFQVVAVLASMVMIIRDDSLMAGDRLEQSGLPYFFAVAVGLFIIYSASSPRLRQTFFEPGPASMNWQVFSLVVSLLLLAQLIFTGYSNGLESLLNHWGLTAMEELKSASNSSQTWSMFVYGNILAPVTEEIVFRGYVLRTLRPAGTSVAILFSAFLFGLYHLNIMQSPFAFLMGLVLGFVAVNYGITWSILVHAFNNLVLGDGLGKLADIVGGHTADVISTVIIVGGSLVGLWVLWVKRNVFKEWYSEHHFRKHELKLVFLNWLSILITVISLAAMLISITRK